MKLKHTKVVTLGVTLITFGLPAGGAKAAIVVDYADSAGGLTVAWSGSIDTTALTMISSSVNLTDSAFSRIHTAQFIATTVIGSSMNAWNGMTTIGGAISSFGGASGGVITAGSVPFAYQVNPQIWLPSTYVSGSNMSGSSFFAGESIASTGINKNYRMDWGSGVNADSISVTLSPVPEPTSALLLGLGALGFAARRKRTN